MDAMWTWIGVGVVGLLVALLGYLLGRRGRRPTTAITTPPTPPSAPSISPWGGDEEPRRLSRVRSFLLGILLVGVLTGVAYTLISWPYNIGVAFVVFGYFGVAGLISIPIAHRGVPTIFGGRLLQRFTAIRPLPDGTPEEVGLVRARYELSEGWSWILPRPIMAAEAVDARERSSRADKFTVISSNNVRITVEPSAIRWRVENPGQVLSVGEEVIDRSLVELVQQNLRSTVRTLNDDDAVAARDLILDGIQRRADQRAIEWGIDVIEVLVGELSRPPEVQEDYEKARREERQREAERIELEHVRERIRELMAAPLNFTPEQALEIVQTERDKVKKTIDEKKVTISSESRGVVSAALTALLGRRP